MTNHTPDLTDRPDPDDSPFTPMAVLGAFAMTAGLATAYMAWQAPRSVSTRQRQALVAYLRDHLAGSDIALSVVQRLGSTHASAQDQAMFRRLANEFEQERTVVRTLLARLGSSGRSIKRAAGYASGSVLSVTAGGAPGDLSLLRTLEALAIGVQGKRCLWRGLQNLDLVGIAHDDIDFFELEGTALRQWEAIDERRRELVVQTFSMAGLRT